MLVRYIQGEDKYVKIRIHSPDNEPFIIESAQYELLRYNQIVVQGPAVITEHCISAKLSPNEKGHYTLIFTYYVADTVRKVKIDIEVV